jgi:hypothetical protein
MACALPDGWCVAQDMVLVEQLRDDGSLARITFSSGGEEVDVLELETLCEKVMPGAPTQPLIPPATATPVRTTCRIPPARCMGRERQRSDTQQSLSDTDRINFISAQGAHSLCVQHRARERGRSQLTHTFVRSMGSQSGPTEREILHHRRG